MFCFVVIVVVVVVVVVVFVDAGGDIQRSTATSRIGMMLGMFMFIC